MRSDRAQRDVGLNRCTATNPPTCRPTTGWLHTNEQIELWLAKGLHSRELIAYLGEAEFELLSPLARAAARANIDHNTQVFIVPGIMGTQLGRRATRRGPPTCCGSIRSTSVRTTHRSETVTESVLKPLGAVPYTYLALKLRLSQPAAR